MEPRKGGVETHTGYNPLGCKSLFHWKGSSLSFTALVEHTGFRVTLMWVKCWLSHLITKWCWTSQFISMSLGCLFCRTALKTILLHHGPLFFVSITGDITCEMLSIRLAWCTVEVTLSMLSCHWVAMVSVRWRKMVFMNCRDSSKYPLSLKTDPEAEEPTTEPSGTPLWMDLVSRPGGQFSSHHKGFPSSQSVFSGSPGTSVRFLVQT